MVQTVVITPEGRCLGVEPVLLIILTDEEFNVSGRQFTQEIHNRTEDVITGNTFDSELSHGREELFLHIQSTFEVSNNNTMASRQEKTLE